MTRKRIKEFNDSLTDSSLQLSEIKESYSFKVLKSLDARRTRRTHVDINESRDYKTPEFETPQMNALKQQILDELDRSVTRRKGQTTRSNLCGTPKAARTATVDTITLNSPINEKPQKRVVDLKKSKEFYREDSCDPQPQIPDVCVTFDDLKTDDDSDVDEARHYSHWAHSWRKYSVFIERFINSDMIDLFFRAGEEISINPSDIFKDSSPAKFRRNRSSMWENFL